MDDRTLNPVKTAAIRHRIPQYRPQANRTRQTRGFPDHSAVDTLFTSGDGNKVSLQTQLAKGCTMGKTDEYESTWSAHKVLAGDHPPSPATPPYTPPPHDTTTDGDVESNPADRAKAHTTTWTARRSKLNTLSESADILLVQELRYDPDSPLGLSIWYLGHILYVKRSWEGTNNISLCASARSSSDGPCSVTLFRKYWMKAPRDNGALLVSWAICLQIFCFV